MKNNIVRDSFPDSLGNTEKWFLGAYYKRELIMSDLKVETIKFDIINYYGSWKVFQDFDNLVVIYKDMKENFDFRNSDNNLAIAKETSF